MRTPSLSVNQLLRKAKTFIKRGDLAGAKRSYQSILEKYPGNQQAKDGLKSLQSQQATPQGTGLNQALDHLIALFNQGKLQEIIQKAIPLTQQYPDSPPLWNILGTAYFQLGGLNQAADCYTKVIRLNPKIAEPYNNLGTVFNDLSRHEEAVQCYNKALQYRADYAEAHNNLGVVFKNMRRHKEAIQSYIKALQHRPDYVNAHYNLAFVLLHQGKLAQGWQEYEWRLKKKEYRELINQIECYEQDLWNGKTPLQGKTILLNAEQGLGDTIQFCRYAKLLEQQGATVILSVQPPLQRLMQTLSPTVQVVGENIPRQFDAHCQLMSLPYLLQTELDTIPADIPYLFAEPERQTKWQALLDTIPAEIPYLFAEPKRQASWQALLDSNDYKIGIAWQGSKKFRYDHLRSFPLFHFEGLSKLAGVRLISLQKNKGVEQIGQYRDRVDVAELGQEYDLGNFIDTAAIMTCLDLVITSDSAIAHLAGALGIKTWVLLPYVSDWRWLEERTDSPWYPGMCLFRQAEPGDWAGVFKQVESTLCAQLGCTNVIEEG